MIRTDGAITLSGRMVGWIGSLALAAITAGAAGALGTYRTIAEMRVELRSVAARQSALEAAREGDGRERRGDASELERRLRAVEMSLADVNATLRILVDRR
jgi:hypothetical protein